MELIRLLVPKVGLAFLEPEDNIVAVETLEVLPESLDGDVVGRFEVTVKLAVDIVV